jgi:phage major head subunit gpT-like protein
MIINQASIKEAFSAFNTVFNKAFSETEVQYTKVAMEVPSETRDETYAWLGAVPSMREWIGDREIKNLAAYGYTIRNKDFELTVSVPRNDIEDDRIGVFKPMFQDLAYSARLHPDKLVFGLLPKAFTELCFDGKPFISDSHTPGIEGKKVKAQSNKGTAQLTPDSYVAARGERLRIVPDLVVVSPQNEAVARTILEATEIHQVTNIYKGTAELLVVPDLAANPEQWFLLCTKRPVKPFIFQNRRKPQLVAKDRPNDDNVFWDKEFIYGVDARCNAGYGLWQLAFGSTGEVPPATTESAPASTSSFALKDDTAAATVDLLTEGNDDTQDTTGEDNTTSKTKASAKS